MEVILKVIILGKTGVGKSTLMHKITEKEAIYDNMPSTIGVDFGVINENNLKIQFWDTAGQERFASIVNLYFKNVNFVLLVYDLSERYNMENVMYYLNLCKDKNVESPILIVGNKSDQKEIYPANIDDKLINEYNIIGHLKINCQPDSNDFISVKNYMMNYAKDKYNNKKKLEGVIKLGDLEKNRYRCCTLI